ncbi:MAG: ABC transporter permease [Actinomycetota bacterium]
MGTVLGVAALIGTLGLTDTAAAQIGRRFDLLKATEVRLRPVLSGDGLPFQFPENVEERLSVLNGVVDAGVHWKVKDDARVGALPPGAGDDLPSTATVIAASAGALAAMQPTTFGRTYDQGQDVRSEHVAIVGGAVAQRLGLSLGTRHPHAILVDGRPFTVVGIVTDVARNPQLLLSVAIPPTVALDLWPSKGTSGIEVLIRTRIGAAQLIGRQAPLAVDPAQPERYLAIVPPLPSTLREAVASDVRDLFLLLALVTLVVGAMSIANTTLVSVLERVPEIGLRRALGASRVDVAGQFLLESCFIGGGGGVLGMSLGLVVVVTVSASLRWIPVLRPSVLIAAPLVGALVGLVAGVYPAFRASRIEPVEALRR